MSLHSKDWLKLGLGLAALVGTAGAAGMFAPAVAPAVAGEAAAAGAGTGAALGAGATEAGLAAGATEAGLATGAEAGLGAAITPAAAELSAASVPTAAMTPAAAEASAAAGAKTGEGLLSLVGQKAGDAAIKTSGGMAAQQALTPKTTVTTPGQPIAMLPPMELMELFRKAGMNGQMKV